MNFIEIWTAQDEANQRDYRDLITTIDAAGNLPDVEARRLIKLARAIGIDRATVQTHAQAVLDYRRFAAIAAEEPQIRAEMKAATNKLQQFRDDVPAPVARNWAEAQVADAQHAEAKRAKKAEFSELMANESRLRSAVTRIGHANQELARLAEQHTQLFSTPMAPQQLSNE